MRNGPLGILERVELRDVWLSEATDFTPWLAGAENLAQLGQAIGVELELEAQEKNVGPFRADILCKDIGTGNWVLIENQLERTDHTHLGQLLTYGAGLNAVTIVWVAAQFTEEHRATLDWLNAITDEGFQFFGLEVELWKIGDSPAAPKFNIVSKPNDWTRSVSQAARRIENEPLTDTREKQLQFWTEFVEFLRSAKSQMRPQKTYPRHWLDFSIGRSGFSLNAHFHRAERRLGVELYLNDEDSKAYFYLLSKQKKEVEEECGFPLEWDELPGRKASRIVLRLYDVDPFDQTKWPEYRQWMKVNLERFDKVFRSRVRALNAGDWQKEVQSAFAGN